MTNLTEIPKKVKDENVLNTVFRLLESDWNNLNSNFKHKTPQSIQSHGVMNYNTHAIFLSL